MVGLLVCALFFALASAQDGESSDTLTSVHGIIASIAWVILFPLGAILLRVINSSSAWWVHALTQSLAILLVIVSAATGIVLAQDKEEIDTYHAIIGLFLFAVVFFQAAGGILHHVLYQKQNRRTVITHVHVWLGRVIITLGMINGGLGLLLAGEGKGKAIAYGVVAGIIYLAFVLISLIRGNAKRRSRQLGAK